MNYEELQNPEVLRKAMNYARWMDAVDHSRKFLQRAQADAAKWEASLNQILAMTEEERTEYGCPPAPAE